MKETIEQVHQIDLPGKSWPGALVSMNELRGRSKHLHHKTAPWRDYGFITAKKAIRDGRLKYLPPGVRLWMEVRHATNHRRDTPNIMPSAKAFVDGLIDAGVVSDDKDGVLEGPLIRRIYPNGEPLIRLIFEVVGTEALGITRGIE